MKARCTWVKASSKVFVKQVLSQVLAGWWFFLSQGVWALVPEADAQTCWLRSAWQLVPKAHRFTAGKQQSVGCRDRCPGRQMDKELAWLGPWTDSYKAWSVLRIGLLSLWTSFSWCRDRGRHKEGKRALRIQVSDALMVLPAPLGNPSKVGMTNPFLQKIQTQS